MSCNFALLLVDAPYLQNEIEAKGCKLTANESWVSGVVGSLSGDDVIAAVVS